MCVESNTHRTKNNTTNVAIQQNSRKLLMMDILMSETCSAQKKWNKIASDIKLVFYSSSVCNIWRDDAHQTSRMLLEPGQVFAPSQLISGHCHACAILLKTWLWGPTFMSSPLLRYKIEALRAYFHDVLEIQEKSCPYKTIPKVRSSCAFRSGTDAWPIAWTSNQPTWSRDNAKLTHIFHYQPRRGNVWYIPIQG